MSSSPGLVPGANTSGLQVKLPFAPQQGGQATLGGAINPLLPINTGGSSSFGTFPQGPVSTSASSGFPAGSPAMTSGTTTGIPANTGGATSGPIVPVTGGAGGTGSTTGNLGIGNLSQQQQDKLFKELDKTYGGGMASLIMKFLMGGAGYNPQVLQNLIAQLQPGFERGQQNLMQQFSAGGSRFGSGAEVGMADLISQQNLEVGSIAAKLYEDSVNNFINVMMGTAAGNMKRIGSSPGLLGSIPEIIGGGSGGGGGGGASTATELAMMAMMA